MDLVEITTLVAVFVVPWLTFRYAQTKDRRDWVRQQRALVYIDLLTEASAELDWLEHRRLAIGDGGDASTPFPDHRLPGLERRKLGARVTVRGSREVRRMWDDLSAHGVFALFGRGDLTNKSLLDARVALTRLTGQITNETEPEHGYRPWWRERPVPILPR